MPSPLPMSKQCFVSPTRSPSYSPTPSTYSSSPSFFPHSPRSVSKSFILTLGAGITFGFSFAYLLLSVISFEKSDTFGFTPPAPSSSSSYSRFFPPPSSSHPTIDHRYPNHPPNNHDDHGHLDSAHSSFPSLPFHPADLHEHPAIEGSVADQLFKSTRVLCWVMTSPSNHASKAKHVKATWAKRCNSYLFMSSEEDPSLPTVKLNVSEGRNHLWAKTRLAFDYIYRHHINDADWFLKADDDTYVIVENLRYFLSQKSPHEPAFYGCKFKPYVKQGYMSGGAGYVLSREAVIRFGKEIGHPTHPVTCHNKMDEGSEDVDLGKCMEALGVIAGDSRDSRGRGRFFPFVPEHHLIPGHVKKDFWYWQWIYYPSQEGFDCCSDTAVSFHYVTPNMMYVMDYLLYHLRPYGISYGFDTLISDNLTQSSTSLGTVPSSSTSPPFSPMEQDMIRDEVSSESFPQQDPVDQSESPSFTKETNS